MVTVKRPLLLFGARRPTCLLMHQLRIVKRVAVACSVLLVLAVAQFYLADPQPQVVTIIRISMLLLAALPGILLEFYLERNVRAGHVSDDGQQPVTLYWVEVLQLAFVLNLAVFLLLSFC